MRMRITVGQAFNKTVRTFGQAFPTLLAVLGLVSLVTTIGPPQMITDALTIERGIGPLVGAVLGSVAAGHPLTSYVLAGELQSVGVGLATIVAFLVSWISVGVVQLPAEMASLGTKFAICRNIICFVSSIVIGYLMAWTLGILM